MTEEQAKWAEKYSWFRSMRNVREYCGGEWYEVTVYDAVVEYDCQFDSYRAMVDWASKQY